MRAETTPAVGADGESRGIIVRERDRRVMPSRRAFLLGAGGAAASGLAGCLSDEDGLSPVVARDDPIDPRGEATVVGFDVTTLGHGERGRAVARSVLYERTDGTLLCYSEPRLISARLDAAWRTAGVTVTHDWTPDDGPPEGRVTAQRSGFVRAAESTDTPYRLGTDRGPARREWTFRVRPPTASTVTPPFRSAFAPETPLSAGETAIEVRTDARVSNWRVRSDRFAARVAVDYRPDGVE
jgi:hypothetical protein